MVLGPVSPHCSCGEPLRVPEPLLLCCPPSFFEASPYSISDGVLFADIPACRLECVSSPAASGLAARFPFPDFPQILLLHRRKI